MSETTDYGNYFDMLFKAGNTYLGYDQAKEQAKLNAQVAIAQANASPLIEQAKAEVEAIETRQALMAIGILAGCLLLGIGAMKLMKKW